MKTLALFFMLFVSSCFSQNKNTLYLMFYPVSIETFMNSYDGYTKEVNLYRFKENKKRKYWFQH